VNAEYDLSVPIPPRRKSCWGLESRHRTRASSISRRWHVSSRCLTPAVSCASVAFSDLRSVSKMRNCGILMSCLMTASSTGCWPTGVTAPPCGNSAFLK
jgi:hypothetical protein